jgi:CDP-6-deoxy-D-xylo-4-hexulose-3-dehydrase
MKYRVPLAYNTMGEAEISRAEDVLRTGMLTQGAEVERFEAMLADYAGVKHAILVNSGSSANLVAIEAIAYLSRLKPELTGGEMSSGDEVIIQGLNWPSTIKPILNQGLQPVFCDIGADSLNATVAAIDAVRTPKTRMVIAVPILGNPQELDAVRAYCEEQRLVLFEDACESLGAVTESGRPVGSLGIASALSFYFSHHITTIEGGAILTNCSELADLCYALRSHGWTRHLKLQKFTWPSSSEGIDDRFCFVLPGYNVRSTELNAVIGQVQLSRLDDMLARRTTLTRGRISAIKEQRDLISVPGSETAGRHSWMTTPLLFQDRDHRRRAQASLEAAGIETRPIVAGNMLRHPVAGMFGLKPDQPELPVCDAVFERGVMIGLNPFSDEPTEAHIHGALRAAALA